MAQKPETKFRAKFQKRLDTIPNSWFESIQQKSISGTPDIIGCVNGGFVGMELKALGGKLSKLQELKLTRIGEAGGLGVVVDEENMEDVLAMLRHIATIEDET